jgi:hypothetical protein
MKKYYPLLLLLCLGYGWADELAPRTPEYSVPHLPEQPGTLLPREGMLWVEGAVLSPPCRLAEPSYAVIRPGVLGNKSTVSVSLTRCAESDDTLQASLPVTVRQVTAGMLPRVPHERTTWLRPGNNRVVLNVPPDARAMFMEIAYE